MDDVMLLILLRNTISFDISKRMEHNKNKTKKINKQRFG